MVAYSFKARFAEPIRSGAKRQTIRAHRRRHVHEGEELQLYIGMRTKSCHLVARAICYSVQNVTLNLDGSVFFHQECDSFSDDAWLQEFAARDGFRDWPEMRRFWNDEHPGVLMFEGVMIQWSGIYHQ